MSDISKNMQLVQGYINSALISGSPGGLMTRLSSSWEGAHASGLADEFVLALIGELVATRQLLSIKKGPSFQVQGPMAKRLCAACGVADFSEHCKGAE